MQPPVVTVLGGTGFIGSAVAAELARAGLRVRRVGRRSTEPSVGSIETVRADLTEPGVVRHAVKGSDAVVHLAGHTDAVTGWRVAGDPSPARQVIVGILEDAVAALATEPDRQGRRPLLVLASSVAVTTTDGSGYAGHKAAAEALLAAADAVGSVRGVALRLPTVYGVGAVRPVLDGGIVATLARRALRGEALPLWGGGQVLRDLLEVDDAARAFAVVADPRTSVPGGVYDVGTGRSVALREVAALVRDAAARSGAAPVTLVDTPAPAYATAADLADVQVDPSALAAATGWHPLTEPVRGVPRLVQALSDDADRR